MTQYIYILINPSFKGLLKIGRTDRSPEERARELSNSSNMPTPFVVAYDEEVPDSQVAEKLVHDELMRQGFRVNDSREFFSIPLKHAIQVVSQIAEQVRNSLSNVGEFSIDSHIGEKSTAEYYFQQGLNAQTGSANALQDYAVAYHFFEKAIALGCVEAHIFMGYLYIGGDGVRQSADMALKILKEGGDKGDPRCYQVMWSIYAGNTKLNLRHEGNAELCFQWFLDSAKESVEPTDISDYLDHSYEILDEDANVEGSGKYPINKFPGKFVSIVIDLQIERLQHAFHKMRDARLACISLDQAEALKSPDAPSNFDIIAFHMFLSNCVQDGNGLMKRVMNGVAREDLEYCFSRAKNVKQTVDGYMPYISMQPNIGLPNYETDVIQKQKKGFFSKFFS